MNSSFSRHASDIVLIYKNLMLFRNYSKIFGCTIMMPAINFWQLNFLQLKEEMYYGAELQLVGKLGKNI